MLTLFSRAKTRRFFCSALDSRTQISLRKKIAVASLIFVCSFVAKSFYSVDLLPLMYTDNQPFRNLTHSYHLRAGQIVETGDFLDFNNRDASDTAGLARAPGYSIYLSFIYSLFAKDFFIVQIVQNAINSLSAVILFLITGLIVSWRIGAIAGLLCAVSQSLSVISNLILPDSLCALPILSGILLLILAQRHRYHPYWLYALAGILFGIATWLRSQNLLLSAFLFILLVVIHPRRLIPFKPLILMITISILLIVPITIRNYLVYGEFVLINIGLGIVLWEGIAEAGGSRFGAVATDREVAAQEAIEYGNPEYGDSWATPDGIKRDRDRVRKSLAVMARHPFWSANAALGRMVKMIKYPAKGEIILNNASPQSLEIIENGPPPDKVKLEWRDVRPDRAPFRFESAISWMRPVLRIVQQVINLTSVGAMLLGAASIFIISRRRALLLVSVPIYYLIFQSPMHTEARYTAPMQHFAFVLMTVGWTIAIALIWKWASELYKQKIASRQATS